eukprot:m.135555 g.135555  ORF g.135555 m.135555 type:complete len:333 (-) comp13978_c0_seq1:99-1097(-)
MSATRKAPGNAALRRPLQALQTKQVQTFVVASVAKAQGGGSFKCKDKAKSAKIAKSKAEARARKEKLFSLAKSFHQMYYDCVEERQRSASGTGRAFKYADLVNDLDRLLDASPEEARRYLPPRQALEKALTKRIPVKLIAEWFGVSIDSLRKRVAPQRTHTNILTTAERKNLALELLDLKHSGRVLELDFIEKDIRRLLDRRHKRYGDAGLNLEERRYFHSDQALDQATWSELFCELNKTSNARALARCMFKHRVLQHKLDQTKELLQTLNTGTMETRMIDMTFMMVWDQFDDIERVAGMHPKDVAREEDSPPPSPSLEYPTPACSCPSCCA